MSNIKTICVIICTLLVVLLVKCSTVKKPSYQKVKTVSFELPYIPSTWGYFYEKDSLYFYTHNYPTYKNIDILNSKGKVLYSIDLSKQKAIIEMTKVEVHSLDSIFILTKNPSSLFVLNKNTKLQNKIAIDSLFFSKTEYTKEKVKHLQTLCYGNMIKKGNLLTNIFLMDTTFHTPENLYETRLYSNKYESKMPQFIYIKNIFETNSKILYNTSWVSKIIRKEDEDFNMMPFYVFLENKIIFCISHDRHIYFVNPEDLSFERKIPVFSDYTELEYKKPKITKEPPKTPYVYKAMYKGAIINVFNYQNENFVLVKHETPLPQKEEMISIPDPFSARYSVIIYDKQWKKQKEILLPEKEKFVAFLPNKQFITRSKTKNARQVTFNFYQIAE